MIMTFDYMLLFAELPTNCFVVLGVVLRCDVTGKILMKCFLSGMPDLKLGLNDKIGLEKESQLKSRPTKRWLSFGHDFLTFFIPIIFFLHFYLKVVLMSYVSIVNKLVFSIWSF
jgi:hypothetical protein